jgi:uncharacterized protein YegJ (DUF2314 family)
MKDTMRIKVQRKDQTGYVREAVFITNSDYMSKLIYGILHNMQGLTCESDRVITERCEYDR